MIQHPTLEELSGYVHGTLPEEAAETVAEHVAGCENCDTLVSQLERDPDQFLQAIRVPDTHEMAEVDSVCQQVLVRIQQVGLDVTVELNAPQAAPSAASPPLGQIGPYRLLEKLGQGGMGTVYKALHIKLDKLVALKVLSADRMQDPQAVSRFEREMKAVGKLEHPHLIRAFDAGEADGTHFLVMEYVAGEDLGSLAKRLGQLPIAEACELIRQAAVGLQYAHDHGLVHRDIKPANLLVAFSGQLSAVSSQEDATGIPKLNADRCPLTATLKILDLGLALLQEQANDAGELTSAGQVMGTLDYMAPEQCGDSHQVDIRADIYSLGATLYRLLTGRAPFGDGQHKSPAQKIAALTTKAPVPIRELRPDVPAELAFVLDRMLAKQPGDRFATPAEVARALAPFAAGSDLARLMPAVRTADATTPASASTFDHVSSALAGTDSQVASKVDGSLREPNLRTRSVRSTVRRVLIATAAGALGLLFFGIVVKIYNDKGEQVAEIPVPPGGKAVIVGDGSSRQAPRDEGKATKEAGSPQASKPESPSAKAASSRGASGPRATELPPWDLPADFPPPAVAPFSPEEARQHQERWAKFLKREVVEENSIGMKFAIVPPGDFTMGTSDEDEQKYTQHLSRAAGPEVANDRANLEQRLPSRRVRLTQALLVGTTEVTWDHFRQFVEATDYKTTAEHDGRGGKFVSPDRSVVTTSKDIHWRTPGPYQPQPNEPVTQVMRNDADAFCDWLSRKEGKKYRLPTEAEWEFACRAGSEKLYVAGDKPTDLKPYAWVLDFTPPWREGKSPLQPVAQRKANSFGLFDMLGNVWEPCAGFLDGTQGQPPPAVDPQRSDPFCGATRGSAYNHSAAGASPELHFMWSTPPLSNVGFRVVQELPRIERTVPDTWIAAQPCEPMGHYARVARPTRIAGLRSWTVTLAGLPRSSKCVAWSPKGDRIAVASGYDGIVRLYDSDGQLVKLLFGHGSWLRSLAWSPDGGLLASAEQDQTIRFWNPSTGTCVRAVATPNLSPTTVEFSPDGKWLAVGTVGFKLGILMVDVASGSARFGPNARCDIDLLCWSPDGTRLLSNESQNPQLHIWNAETLELETTFAVGQQPIGGICWSPDGTTTAVVTGPDSSRELRLIDSTTRELKASFPLKPGAKGGSFSRDGRRFACPVGDGLQILEVDGGKEIARRNARYGSGGAVAWSPDEDRIATSGGYPLQVCDVESGRPILRAATQGQSGFNFPSFTAEHMILGIGGGSVAPWDYETGEKGETCGRTDAGRIAWSPDGKWCIGQRDGQSTRTMLLLEGDTAIVSRELGAVPTDSTPACSWSPDSLAVAVLPNDGIVRVWRVSDGPPGLELKINETKLNCACWSPDGGRVAAAAADQAIRIWDATTGTLVKTYAKLPAAPRLLCWNNTRESLFYVSKNEVLELDLATGKASPVFRHREYGDAYGVTQTPDGSFLATTSGVITLYQLKTGKVTTLPREVGHGGGGIHWLPDSRRVVIPWNGQGTLEGYDLERREPLGQLVSFADGNHHVCIGPSGHYRGSDGCDVHLVYVAEFEDGHQETFTPKEFAAKFGWKNDPDKATFMKLEE